MLVSPENSHEIVFPALIDTFLDRSDVPINFELEVAVVFVVFCFMCLARIYLYNAPLYPIKKSFLLILGIEPLIEFALAPFLDYSAQ